MNNERAKKFILATCILHGDRTLERQMQYMRNGGVLCSLLFLFMLYWVVFIAYDGVTFAKAFFFLTVLAVALTAVVSYKKQKCLAHTIEEVDNCERKPHRSKYNPSFGAAGAGLGILLINAITISQGKTIVGGIIVMIPILLLCIYTACKFQYKLQLLRKYCPEIRGIKATG